MCRFFSAIGLRDGQVLWHPMLDSHSDLLVYYDLSDVDDYQTRFVKLELVPHDNDWLDPDTWAFTVDEETAPVWCDDEMQAGYAAKMRTIANRMIIKSGKKRLIVDGCWIIGGDATVRDVRGGRIVRVQDSAHINDVRGSALISNVCGSARITNVGDSSVIDNVYGSARISGVWGAAHIGNVVDGARISGVGNYAMLDDSARRCVLEEGNHEG